MYICPIRKPNPTSQHVQDCKCSSLRYRRRCHNRFHFSLLQLGFIACLLAVAVAKPTSLIAAPLAYTSLGAAPLATTYAASPALAGAYAYAGAPLAVRTSYSAPVATYAAPAYSAYSAPAAYSAYSAYAAAPALATTYNRPLAYTYY